VKTEERFGRLLEALASAEPAPASGSAAAAVVAVSAALLQKVALRSPTWSGAARAHSRAEALRLRAEELIELDSIAFLHYLDAIKSGDGVEAARQKTVDVPREIASRAAEVA
jgi:formiminotetrahydrofolate cyclodeaminase